MSRPGSLQFQFLTTPKTGAKPARQIIGEHACEVCGGRAPFGYGGSYLRGIEGRWRCRDHRLEDETKAGAA
jgi:hypothetical protein